MLLDYPWFRVSKPIIEQEFRHEGSRSWYEYRWRTPPGRFVAIDRALLPDRGEDRSPLFVGVRFRILSLDEKTGIYYWAIRDDAWWVPLAVAFDRLYSRARDVEIAVIRFCLRRGWVHRTPGEGFSWRKAREVTR